MLVGRRLCTSMARLAPALLPTPLQMSKMVSMSSPTGAHPDVTPSSAASSVRARLTATFFGQSAATPSPPLSCALWLRSTAVTTPRG